MKPFSDGKKASQISGIMRQCVGARSLLGSSQKKQIINFDKVQVAQGRGDRNRPEKELELRACVAL